MPAVPPAEANRARIMPRRVADADVRGGAGFVHADTGGHARYVDIAMPPTNVSNAWPPPGTPARNTWPADVLGETSSRNPSRDILCAAGNPPREIDFSATCNQTGTQCCWEPMAPCLRVSESVCPSSETLLCVGKWPHLESHLHSSLIPTPPSRHDPPHREPLAAINPRR